MIIESHPKLIVVGQGRVGLPLAMRAVEAGFDVLGVDADPSRVAALREGASAVDDVPDVVVRAARDSGRYAVDGDFGRIDGFDFAVVTVPIERRASVPDLGSLESAARSLSLGLRRGATVVFESTPPPGTTAEVLVPILEQGSGLSAGRDFSVGFSTARLDPDGTARSSRTTPALVSGIDPESLAKVTGLYADLADTTVHVDPAPPRDGLVLDTRDVVQNGGSALV